MAEGSESETSTSRKRNLRKAFSTIERTGNQLGLEVSEIKLAESTYKQYIQEREASLNNIEATAMACLYISAKLNGNAITPEDTIDFEHISSRRKEVLRRSKKVTSTLSLDLDGFYDCSSFVDQICEGLDVDESIRTRALEIVDICEEEGIVGGKKPAAIAAAAIYNASIEDGNSKLTQKDIAKVADVTTVTIRSRYQEQRELL